VSDADCAAAKPLSSKSEDDAKSSMRIRGF
jgi:hypothetical protein